MAPQAPSEEVLGRKWDRCLADTTIKIGTGAAVGLIASLIFFKRKSWPVTLGTGIGLGMGYANCQHTFYSQCPPRHKYGPPFWQMDSEAKEKWKKQWEERWKSFKPKEVVHEKKEIVDEKKEIVDEKKEIVDEKKEIVDEKKIDEKSADVVNEKKKEE